MRSLRKLAEKRPGVFAEPHEEGRLREDEVRRFGFSHRHSLGAIFALKTARQYIAIHPVAFSSKRILTISVPRLSLPEGRFKAWRHASDDERMFNARGKRRSSRDRDKFAIVCLLHSFWQS